MILYIIRWTLIYSVLIFLLHNLYLFFQKNLTATKNTDYYSSYSGETVVEKDIQNQSGTYIKKEVEKTSPIAFNNEFKLQMDHELNDFISKIR